ncbi:MAG: hypothetical protein ACT4O0_17990 [Pseudonocardia sp.]
MALEPYSVTFRRVVSLVTHFRANDHRAVRTILDEIGSSPVMAGATISALVKLVNTLDSERPSDLDEWLRGVLLRLAAEE